LQILDFPLAFAVLLAYDNPKSKEARACKLEFVLSFTLCLSFLRIPAMIHTTDSSSRFVTRIDSRRSESLIDNPVFSPDDADFTSFEARYDDRALPNEETSQVSTLRRRARLIDDLAPSGAFEIELVERIVTTLLAIESIATARSARVDSGEIALESKECLALCRFEAHLARLFSKLMQDLRGFRRDREKHANDRERVSIRDLIANDSERSNQYPIPIEESDRIPIESRTKFGRGSSKFDRVACSAIDACLSADFQDTETSSHPIETLGEAATEEFDRMEASLKTEPGDRSNRRRSDRRNIATKSEIERRLIEHRHDVFCSMNNDPLESCALFPDRTFAALNPPAAEPHSDVRRDPFHFITRHDDAAPA
jgi:hypothetical protein